MITINKDFLMAFANSPVNSCAVGILDCDGKEKGFIAIKPKEDIPNETLQKGMAFGNKIEEIDGQFLLYFGFKFYDFKTYHMLVQPQNPIVQAALDRMTKTNDYCFLLFKSTSFFSFMNPMDQEALQKLEANWDIFRGTICLDDTYEDALNKLTPTHFGGERPLNWVFREKTEYLELTANPFSMAQN